MKITALAIVLIAVVALALASWLVNNQIISLQNQIIELQDQNSELQDQNSDLQDQVSELQLQNREKQDRLADFTYQLALERHLRVKITAFTWEGGFHPIVGVTLFHPVNVTVQNDDVIPLSGLTLTVILVHKDRGTQIGDAGVTRIGRLNAGKTYELSGGATTTIGTSLDGAVCVIRLTVGDVVLDEGTYGLS